jgi:hypothetical protein
MTRKQSNTAVADALVNAGVVPAVEETPAPTVTAQLEKAADEHLAKAEAKKSELTPSQAIGIFAENLAKPTAKLVKSLYNDLLAEFAAEGTSKIAIGKTLMRLRDELGENYRTFAKDCVITVLRKSEATLYNYIALAEVATLTFASNKVVASALFRIWSAEGCFDSVNGKLKPEVGNAIKACGGIPESTDSLTCEQWARKFVTTIDKLNRTSRSAQVGGRAWDVDTTAKKSAQTIKAFRAYIKNQAVSKDLALNLFTDIAIEAILNGHFTDAEFDECIDRANEKVAARAEKMEADNPPETETEQPTRKPSRKVAA